MFAQAEEVLKPRGSRGLFSFSFPRMFEAVVAVVVVVVVVVVVAVVAGYTF